MNDELTDAIKNNPLALAIHTTINVMRVDYATQFNKAFRDSQDVTHIKRRIYKQLIGLEPNCIIDAYEVLIDRTPEYMPSLPQLINEAKMLDRKLHNGIEEQKRISQHIDDEKKTHKKYDPIKKLMEVKKDADITAGNGMDSHEEWLIRKEEARLSNDALTVGVVKKYADDGHLCCYGACKKAGALANNTKGSEHWFCAKHFSMI